MAKPNIVFFLSSPEQNELFQGWVQEYLQPELVGWCFRADTDDAFKEITSAAIVHLLLLDVTRLEGSVQVIEAFRSTHPECGIVVLTKADEVTTMPRDARSLDYPTDFDSWMVVMDTAING